MVTAQNVYKEVNNITQKLIKVGLSDNQNFPTHECIGKNKYQIAYSGMQNLSITLKNVEYIQVYQVLDKEKNYNIKMADGALIQMMYIYENSKLSSHRLAFFPSPFLHEFQNQPEIYEIDEVYADIIAKNILPVPIRFDYDPENHQELDHPKCHLTLGQFKNCRIPVCSPIMPNVFISFILRSFYNTALRKFSDELNLENNLFSKTITTVEQQSLHISIT